MANDVLINKVRSYTSGTPGRSLNSARANHFVVDGPTHSGGPAEAITPAEAFLSGVSSCGVLIIESHARERNMPLKSVEVSIESTRTAADPSTFRGIDLFFQLSGVNHRQANQLVAFYQGR